MAIKTLVTIGAHGFDAVGFFEALTTTGIDTFCDIRLRRGMRGSQYSFANSKSLQQRLQALGIRYIHVKQLAPPQSVRQLQHEEDERQGTAKRHRVALANRFVEAYDRQCLSTFDIKAFLTLLGSDASVVAFFCVEQEPTACHRSLVSAHLAKDLKVEVRHVKP